MTSLFKSIQKYAIIRGISFILLGLILFLQPNQFLQTVIYFIAAYNGILGLFNLVGAIRNKENGFNSQMPIAIFYLVFALIVYLFSKQIISILPILFGLLVMIGGTTRMSHSLNLRQYVNVHWLPMFLYGIALIFVGLLMLFNPFKTVLVLFQFFGISLMITGISEIIAFFRLRHLDV